jgi:hypothetical protein
MNRFSLLGLAVGPWAGVVPKRLVCGEIRREPVPGLSDQAAVMLVKERGMWEERLGTIGSMRGGGRRHCCNFLLDAVSSPCDDGKRET